MKETPQHLPELGRDSLRSAVGVVKRGWIVILTLALLCGAVALVYSMLQKPVYKSTATLYVTSGNEASAQTAYQGSLASQQRVMSYVKLVDSDSVVAPVIGTGGVPLSLGERGQLSAHLRRLRQSFSTFLPRTLTNRLRPTSRMRWLSR